jgi:hypothetical protein
MMNGRCRFFCGIQGFSLLLLAGSSLSSAGQINPNYNVVVNSGFETGNLTGWSVSDATGVSVSSNSLHSGSYGFQAGSAASMRHVTQTIIIDSDNQRQEFGALSFYVKFDGTNSNTFSATINGNVVHDKLAPTLSGWTYMSYSFNPPVITNVIKFSFTNDSGSVLLDDISLGFIHGDCFDGLGHACACPEPSSFALLGLGGIGVAFRAYRKRTQGKI